MARRSRASEPATAFYTTFQVARFLGVSAPTVVNWVNSGLLKAHRTPGGHRRIQTADIVDFARTQNYPIPAGLNTASRPRVLIVDDEPDFCDLLRQWIQNKRDYEVEVAESGFVAGLSIARFKPNVVVMDIMMPGMDGFESLRQLRQDPDMSTIPVIACTAYHDPNVEAAARREGFAAYVEKTAQLDVILHQIDDLVRAPVAVR